MDRRVLACLLVTCASMAGAAPSPYVPLMSAPPVDPASIAAPDLNFAPTPDMVSRYDKYFYFHRDNTDFATALADIQECDSYARGFADTSGNSGYMPAIQNQMVAQYGWAGAAGGAIGGLIGGAIAEETASAERRKMRRINLKKCMGFKEYQTYGLPKDLWSKFNFEEGLKPPSDEDRERKFRIQAKIASGPRPLVGEIKQ